MLKVVDWTGLQCNIASTVAADILFLRHKTHSSIIQFYGSSVVTIKTNILREIGQQRIEIDGHGLARGNNSSTARQSTSNTLIFISFLELENDVETKNLDYIYEFRV